jgi:hypothetical protein
MDDLAEKMRKLPDWEVRCKALNGGPAEEKEAAGQEMVRRAEDPGVLQKMYAELRLSESARNAAAIKAARIYGAEGKHGCLQGLRIGARECVAKVVDEELRRMGFPKQRERVCTPPRGTPQPGPEKALRN